MDVDPKPECDDEDDKIQIEIKAPPLIPGEFSEEFQGEEAQLAALNHFR
jgi:hypothetical protein